MERKFRPEMFKKILRSYLIMSGVACGILVFSGFGLPLVLDTIPYARLAIGKIVSGVTTIGFVVTGSLAIGMISSGLISIGIFAFGSTTCGVVAVGGGAIGVVAIGMNAIGVVAIGYNATGIYALSYKDKKDKNRGRYMFSPERQDAKAVALFTRWMPKLKNAFATES